MKVRDTCKEGLGVWIDIMLADMRVEADDSSIALDCGTRSCSSFCVLSLFITVVVAIYSGVIFSALLSRTIRSWVGNDISEFSWDVAQRRLLRDWCERDLVRCHFRVACFMFRLYVTSQMRKDRLVAGLQLTS